MTSEEKQDFLEEYNEDRLDNVLFYTPKITQHLDEVAIIEEIYAKFPNLLEANKSKKEKEERKALLEFFQEKKLVKELLKKYEMSIIDLVRFFMKHFPYLFNTITYAKKIKKIIEENEYPTESCLCSKKRKGRS